MTVTVTVAVVLTGVLPGCSSRELHLLVVVTVIVTVAGVLLGALPGGPAYPWP
jgi:hypothetical protein